MKGFAGLDLNGDGDYNDFGEFYVDWRVYLATLGVRVDANRDGDWDDIGDISVGSTTSRDDTRPSMPQPPNVTVLAPVNRSQVRVYYDVPVASESNVDVSVVCTPPPGSLFPVGTTTVTCTATDEAGNTRTRTFTVTVVQLNPI